MFLTIVGHRLSSAVSGNNDLQILAPLGREGQVGGDGVDGFAIFELEFVVAVKPALEGVAFLGGFGGLIDVAVVLNVLQLIKRVHPILVQEQDGMELNPVQGEAVVISHSLIPFGAGHRSPQIVLIQRIAVSGGQRAGRISGHRVAVIGGHLMQEVAHAV